MLGLIKDYITQNNLFSNNDKIVLALSGGVDSFVLFDVLRTLKYNIIVAHVNHNKRKESKDELAFIKDLCNKLDIPFRSKDYFHNETYNFHDESHKFRYEFFKSVCNEFNTNIVCTAHHQDDNLETIILNMMSGSNLFGYSGITKKMLLDNIYITRPLMVVNKKQILDYADFNNVKYFEDISNFSDDYKRNRLRHHIIPSIINEQPNIYSKINEYSQLLLESFNFIRNNSIKYLDKWGYKLNVLEFKQLDIALKKDIICLLLENNNVSKSSNLIANILKILESDKSQSQISLKDDLVFVRRYEQAYIASIQTKKDIYIELSLDQKTTLPNGTGIFFTNNLQNDSAKHFFLCYNKLMLPLIIRNRKEGDVINMPYGKKKIKDLFIDLKLVKEKRDEVLLLCDANDQILWVIGYAVSKELQLHKKDADLLLVYEE